MSIEYVRHIFRELMCIVDSLGHTLNNMQMESLKRKVEDIKTEIEETYERKNNNKRS